MGRPCLYFKFCMEVLHQTITREEN